MPLAHNHEPGPLVRHTLAGLQAGVLGSFAMLLVLMAGSKWLGRSVWSMPNLMATVFAGPDAYQNGFTPTSVAGLALIVVIYGALGLVWGFIAREREWKWLTLGGAVAGLLVYEVFFGLIWKQTRPLIALYAPSRQLLLAHFVWGMVLARSPRFSRTLRFGHGAGESIRSEVTM